MKLTLVLDAAVRGWLPGAEWRRRASRLVAAVGPRDGELEVVLTLDPQVQALNRRYRRKDRPTDVLSFSYLSGHGKRRAALLAGRAPARTFCTPPPPRGRVLAGQVLISVQTVRRRHRTARGAEEDALLLVAHGLLHVLGYDHHDDGEAAEMDARQAELLARVPRRRRRRRATALARS